MTILRLQSTSMLVRLVLLRALLIFLAVGSVAHTEPLKFGMSSTFSGPTADLGINMRAGIVAAFDAANRKGGIQYRALSLISLDDGYEPSKTAPNMRTLIEKENVLAIVGNVGTPTAIAAIPISTASKTLFYAAFTGAGVLRKNPPDRYIINYRASYAQETEAMVDALIKYAKLKPSQIAFFTQRDGYGDAGYAGGIAALTARGLTSTSQIVHARYERNTLEVENAIADILAAPTPVKAVIMVGAYAPSARFIKIARENGLKALFLNVSFVGSESLAVDLGPEEENVIVTQVVPPLENNTSEIAKEFLNDLANSTDPRPPTFGAFEAYLAARVLVKALHTLTEPPTRENIIDALESLGSFTLGSTENYFLSRESHQASQAVYPTILHKGRWIQFYWKDIASLHP